MKNLSPEAHDLVLHADNDYKLEHSSKTPIRNNLKKHKAAGSYNSEMAKKAWGYHADRAAMNYHKEFGTADHPWHKMFPPHVRKEAAAHWEEMHKDD